MKVILTGAAGFIGSVFLWKLNSMGIDDVIVVDTKKTIDNNPNLKNRKISAYLTKEELSKRLAKGQFRDVNLMVHLGACTDTTERDKTYLQMNNFEYSQALAEWSLAQNVPFHYASSAAIYGDGKNGYSDAGENLKNYKPLNPYGDSKLKFDAWIGEKNLENQVVGYRYFNVFGPNEYHKGEMRSMVSKAYDQLKEKGVVELFATTRAGYPDGSEERDFVYVKDVVSVMSYFVNHPDQHGIFNVGTGHPRTFKDLAEAVFKALNKDPQIKFIPMPEALRGQYQYHTQADISKLMAAGYKTPFTSLEEAVSDYVKSHLTQRDPTL